MNVSSQPQRIINESWRPRFVASVPAVCCAKTICNGIVGMSDVIISIVTKTPYSAGEIFLASGCTPKDMPPWITVAIISQPLWRKNVACGLWSTVGMA